MNITINRLESYLTELGFKYLTHKDPHSYFELTELTVFAQDGRKIETHIYSTLGYLGVHDL